jgi:Icc protein
MLLAHLSDTHLTTGVLAGQAAGRAHQALARVQALDPRPDCLVVTGDLADHGDPAEYAAALALLGGLDLPVHVVPGNHDHAGRMLRALAGTGYVRAAAEEPDRCYYRVDYPGLRLLCCDSSLPGRVDGSWGPSSWPGSTASWAATRRCPPWWPCTTTRSRAASPPWTGRC